MPTTKPANGAETAALRNLPTISGVEANVFVDVTAVAAAADGAYRSAALALVEDQRRLTTATAYIPIRRLLEALVYAVLSLAPAEPAPVTIAVTAAKPAAKRTPKPVPIPVFGTDEVVA